MHPTHKAGDWPQSRKQYSVLERLRRNLYRKLVTFRFLLIVVYSERKHTPISLSSPYALPLADTQLGTPTSQSSGCEWLIKKKYVIF